MEKKLVNDYKGEIRWRYIEYSIQDFLKEISELQSKGITHINFDEVEGNYFSYREETDEEYTQRMFFQKSKEEKQKERDLETYKKLKEKYDL